MARGPGERMIACLAYVAAHPGCSKSDAARCGTDGPMYPSSVAALVRRGLAHDARTGGRYRLHVTPAGLALLAAASGLLAAGPHGEPAVLVRATDALACPLLSYYHRRLQRLGADQLYLDQVERAYHAVADWQEANPGRVKVPGATRDQESSKPQEG